MTSLEPRKEKVMPSENSLERAERPGRTRGEPSFLPAERRGSRAATLGASRLLASRSAAWAEAGLTDGDVAILQFLAAAELVEADLWGQYNELGGIQDAELPGGSGNRG